MTAILERKPVEYSGEVIIEKAIALGHKELREQAQRVFQYRERRSCPDEWVEGALKSLQIDPFTEESVKAYKAKAERRQWWRNAHARILAKCPDLFGGVGVIAIAVWGLLASIALTLGFGSMIPAWVGTIGLCAFGSLGIAIGIAFAFDKQWLKIEELRWHLVDVNWDWRSLPEFALQTAVDIKTRCPDARIYMDVAKIENRTADPFLVVVSDYKKYYVEVWDEPGFKK